MTEDQGGADRSLSRAVPPTAWRGWPWYVFYAATGTWRRAAPGLHDSIMINGSPRSGTTWLETTLGELTGWPVLHEPTHPPRIPEAIAAVGMNARPYRDPHQRDPAFAEAMERILTGTYLGAGLLARTRTNIEGLWRRRPVVSKHVALNLLLPWIAQQMPWLRVMQLVRHPLAVVASQQAREATYWATATSLSPPYRTFLAAHPEYDVPTDFETVEETLTAMWAIEHAWLRDTRDLTREVLWLRYEEVRADPEGHLRRIAGWLGIDEVSTGALDEMAQPSRSVYWDSTTLSSASPDAAWRDRFDEGSLARMRAVLERLDFPFYGPEAFP